ncbi:MAG: FAD-dependent oxidoreductase, partial [Betaproteobacteria bacterium]|nr:FAD-dependent oxidoreductase [Betaproteobacteria bacterium]
TIVQREPQFLPQEERDAAQILSEALARDGLAIHLNTEVVKVTRAGDEKTAHMVCVGQKSTVTVDEVIAGAGRAPNVEGLGLAAANVDYDEEHGVTVDDFLRTSNPRIYAAGDIIEGSRFTHMAEATARIAVQNALFFGRKRLSSLTVPWCTYTDPEIAHVGMYTRDARKRGIPVKTFTIPMNNVDRAIADGEEEGFVKVTVKDGTDRILGATIVARHAGEMINEITLAMVAGVGFKALSNVIHTYPTQAEAIRHAADAYRRAQLTPLLKRLTTQWLAWNR